MVNANSFLNFRIHDYDNKYNNIELVSLSLLSFLLPIILGHPQIVIGSVINFLLLRSALSMKFTKTLPVILLPSIGVVAGGLLFGGLTPYVVYFIPFIWAGNAIYVLTAKLVSNKFKKNYGLSVIAASFVKAGLIFSGALLMVTVFGFPPVFLTVMGLFQLYTALIGGFTAYGATLIEKKIIN